MTEVACCILCPSGFVLQRDLGPQGDQQLRSPALLDIAGVTALQQWLNAVQSCPLLKSKQLYIVCNPADRGSFESCVFKHQQRPDSCVNINIVETAQVGSCAAPDHVAGLSGFAAAHSLPDVLIIADGAQLCEPGFSLQRFAQHTVTRNADMVSFSSEAHAATSSSAWVQLQDSSINPRVAGISNDPSNANCHSFSLGPVYGLQRATLSRILQQRGPATLQAAVQPLLQSSAVYASPVQCSFDLSTLAGYLFADAFFTFSQQQWSLLHGQISPANTAVQPQSPQKPQGPSQACGLDACPAHAALAEFQTRYASAMVNEAYKRLLAGRSTGGSKLPERFADAGLWRWRRKFEHPVYMTTANDIGAKPPSQPMMPLSWHGIQGEFTKNYIKSEVRTGNFSTGLASSRVHDALTELT